MDYDMFNAIGDAYTYIYTLHVPSHIIASSLGSMAGIAAGILKKKDPKAVLYYGLAAGIGLAALAEIHDLEGIGNSLEKMVRSYAQGYYEVTLDVATQAENLGDSMVTRTTSVSRTVPITKSEAARIFIGYLANIYEELFDLAGGIVGSAMTSFPLYYFIKLRSGES